MNYIKAFYKALVPLGCLIVSGAILNAVSKMAQRGYAGILWTLGAFLSVSFVAVALYSIKLLFGKKEDDEDNGDDGDPDGK